MFLLLVTCTIFGLFYLYHRLSREGRLIAEIPGPKGLPILGNAFQFLISPGFRIRTAIKLNNLARLAIHHYTINSLYTMERPFHTDNVKDSQVLLRKYNTNAKERKKLFQKSRDLYKTYKSVVLLHSLNFRCINVYDPEDVATILSAVQFHEKNVPYSFLKPWLGDGLLTSNGTKWHSRRKMLTPAFHLNILKKFLETFGTHVEQLLKTIESDINNAKIDVYDLTSSISLKILCETAMGVSQPKNLEIIFQKYLNAIETFGHCVIQRVCRVWYFFDLSYNYSKLGLKQKKIVQDLHLLSKNVIEDRRKMLFDIGNSCDGHERKSRHAMMDLLLINEREKRIDEVGIREEVDTFLFAGYDTTATALMFFIMRVANEPTVQDKLHEEMESIFGKSNRTPTMEDLKEMKYTECCIKETLRIYPSIPFISRHLTKEVLIGGFRIPANTQANIMIYDIHHREDLYPEPEKFIPERFLSSNQMQRHPFAYIPFSAGSRNCIGQKYGMLIMKSVIAGLLRRYRLAPITKPEDIVFITDMVLRTTKPIYVQFCNKN